MNWNGLIISPLFFGPFFALGGRKCAHLGNASFVTKIDVTSISFLVNVLVLKIMHFPTKIIIINIKKY